MRIPTPVSAEKANEGGSFEPWPPGKYDFEVHEASEELSKASGRDQIKLTLSVFNDQGSKRTVFDYLGSDEKSQWKVRHFCGAIRMIRQYESGQIDPFDMINKAGRLILAIKRATGDYPADNSVRDYIEAKEGNERAARPAQAPAVRVDQARKAAAQDLDDEIPF